MNQAEVSNKVREKFRTIQELTLMVGRKFSNSLLLCGPGGMGKSFSTVKTLNQAGICFQLLRGYASPAAFYNFLHEHSDQLIVIDDCDNIFKDMIGLNMLKAVLETAEVRRVAWHTTSGVVSVGEFDFTGQIIFLTNLNPHGLSKHMQALMSRVHVYHLDMTPDETIQRIRIIAIRSEYKGVKKSDRLMVARFLKENRDHIHGLNVRHYTKALDLLMYTRSRWRKLLLECVGGGEI